MNTGNHPIENLVLFLLYFERCYRKYWVFVISSLTVVGVGGVNNNNGREATVNSGASTRPARFSYLFKLVNI